MHFRLVGEAGGAFPIGRRPGILPISLSCLRQEVLPKSTTDQLGIPFSPSDQSGILFSSSDQLGIPISFSDKQEIPLSEKGV